MVIDSISLLVLSDILSARLKVVEDQWDKVSRNRHDVGGFETSGTVDRKL
jgi:hypothetical protein